MLDPYILKIYCDIHFQERVLNVAKVITISNALLFAMLQLLKMNIYNEILSGRSPLTLSRDGVIIDGVWIGNLIYWTLVYS
jgi:hypothetical protein